MSDVTYETSGRTQRTESRAYDSTADADKSRIVGSAGEPVGVHDTHLNVIGYHEGIGHLSTNSGINIERASGKKEGIGTGIFTLLESSDFIQPSGDTQMYLQSTSADDADGGSGAQEITIEYFNLAWGARRTVTVIPTGTGQVAISVSDIYRIHKVYTNKGRTADGTITITNQADSILYGGINQYETFMQRAIFYVAEGEKVTCTELIGGSTTSGGVLCRLFASEEDASGNVVTRGRITFEVSNTGIVIPLVISETVTNPNNLRIAIGIAVTAAGVASNQSVSGTIKGFTEPI